LLAKHGVIAITAAISPYIETRAAVRERIENFVEIFMDCPIAVLAERDVKGLYKKALAGEIPHFTGVSDPYEPPVSPDVRVDSSTEDIAVSEERVWALLKDRGLIPLSW
jgi:adenylylsulfate kinase-like enzyme